MDATRRDYPSNHGIADLDSAARHRWRSTVADFLAALDDVAAVDRAAAQGSVRYIVAEATRGRWGLLALLDLSAE